MNTVTAIDGRHASAQRLRERVFQGATFAAALLVLVLLGGVALSLLIGSWPAFAHFKLSFLTREIWNPVTDQYGALAPVYGTLVTSFLALLLAIPVSFGIAIFLTELAPVWLKRPVGVAIELLELVGEIAGAELQADVRAVEVAGREALRAQRLRNRFAGRRDHLRQAECPRAGARFRVVEALLPHQRQQQRR